MFPTHVGDEVHGGNGRLLGPAGDVGGDERQQGDKRSRRRLRHVVADELANRVGIVQAGDEQHSEDGEKHAASWQRAGGCGTGRRDSRLR